VFVFGMVGKWDDGMGWGGVKGCAEPLSEWHHCRCIHMHMHTWDSIGAGLMIDPDATTPPTHPSIHPHMWPPSLPIPPASPQPFSLHSFPSIRPIDQSINQSQKRTAEAGVLQALHLSLVCRCFDRTPCVCLSVCVCVYPGMSVSVWELKLNMG
jgi:hypothetical protein